MKKLTPLALIIILLMTSCSQALYKNKYDWVKVEPKPKSTVVTKTESEFANAIVSNDGDVVVVNDSLVVKETIYAVDTVSPETMVIHRTKVSTQNVCNNVVDEATPQAKKASTVTKREHNNDDELDNGRDWGRILQWTIGTALILTLLFFSIGSTAFLMVMLTIIGIAIGALAVLFIICWLLCELLFAILDEIF